VSGIGVVSNPRSGANKRNPRLARRLAYMLGEKGELGQPGDLDDLVALAERFRDRGIDVLCVNGGDGTVHKVLSAFHQVYGEQPLPLVALLRGGTMNTVASGLGIRGKPEDLLGAVVSRYHDDEPFAVAERNLLVVRDGVNPPRVGFLFGNGLVSNFLEVYYEGGDASPWKAVKVLVRAIGSVLLKGELAARLARPVRGQVEVDGHAWSAPELLTLVAGTVDDIGLGFRPFHAVVGRPGHLQVIGFGCSIGAIVANLWRIRLARPVPAPGVVDQVARGFVLSGAGPQGYMIDGDFYQGGQRIEVAVGPRIRLITG
jgi:diacylglycerol kinase (ATP)